MAKCFMFTDSIASGIMSKDGVINVGEIGRGRTLVKVPVPAVSEVNTRGLVLEIPGDGAFLLICDQSGYRGEWSLREARTTEEWDIATKRVSAHRPPDGTGALQPGHTEGYGECELCKAIGSKPAEKPFCRERCKIVAQGRKAQGAAGGMGGGPEYLLRLSEGYAVEAVRYGRLYGKPHCYRFECINGVVVATIPFEDALSRMAFNALNS